jgi:predicted DNA-binding transcriptional regulator YafY
VETLYSAGIRSEFDLTVNGARNSDLARSNDNDALIFDAPPPPDSSGWRVRLDRAVRARRRVRLVYQDAAGQVTERRVRPLDVTYEGREWRLIAWCELRQDFRAFNLDRMASVQVLRSVFPDEPGRTLMDYLQAV